MRPLQTLALALLTVPGALLAQPNPQVAPAIVLPSVTAYALDRAKVTLPADFSAPLNLLILSFQRDQQSAIDGWLPVIAGMNGASFRVQTWLLPIGPPENVLYKWWLNASLRGSLPASQPRRYTVPLYVNKAKFLGSLQVSSERDVVLLLTDKTGHVLWRDVGPVTDEKKASLTSFLSAWSH
jgi:hypothetical protein